MTRPPSRKPWMVDMPPSSTAVGSRPGKPIAKEMQKRAAPLSRFAPVSRVDEQALAEQARRTRTQDAHVAQSAETSDRMRARMVERLARSGIRHPAVLAAMTDVPRHRFVDDGLASRAYDDTALPIGHAQTISQPYVVAHMCELLVSDLPVAASRARVLEVGTGCGYQAAVLARIAGEVYSIERIRALHDRARDNLRALRLPNLRLVHGDGLAGLPSAQPFDAMVVAAAGEALPDTLLEQLAVGGRVLAPLAISGAGRGGGGEQTLCLFVRTGRSQWSTTLLDAVRFVPLKCGVA